MSLPRAKLSARASSLALAIVAAGLALGGCTGGGFRPLYATGSNADNRFAAMDVNPIPGRVGQRIRNELVFERTAVGGNEVPTDKRLEVRLTENVLTTLVTISGNSTGQVYQLEATYRLVDIGTSKVMFEGRSLGRASFERFESVYSNIRAREDAENRAAASVAADIRTRLAAYMSRT